MSEQLAQLEKKGGGKLKETTLWTNPSPTSSFVAKDVTLSQSYKTFDYIKVTVRMSITNAVQTCVIIPLANFDLYYPSQKASCGISVHRAASETNIRTRSFCPVAETKIHFFAAFTVEATSVQENESLIPTTIIGMKY